jgi:hypothetical protein
MRKLTKTEAVVCQRLMGSAQMPTRLLGIELGLARRTLQTVSGRLFLRGWLRPRLVPNLRSVDLPVVTFTLCHPFQERRAQVVDAWAKEPAVVSSWSSSQSVFGLLVSRDKAEADRILEEIAPPEFGDRGFIVSADLNREPIPIFFDFEAVWSRLAGLGGTISYPQGLGAQEVGVGDSGGGLSTRRLGEISEAVSSAFIPGPSRGRGVLPRSAPTGLLRRLVTAGLVQPRTFLDPLAVSRSVEGFPDGVAMISAELSGTSTLSDLFRALIVESELSPFLLAKDRTHVTVWTLFSRSGGARALEAALPNRTGVLSPHLQEIRIFRESFRDLVELTNYRFDKVLTERDSS